MFCLPVHMYTILFIHLNKNKCTQTSMQANIIVFCSVKETSMLITTICKGQLSIVFMSCGCQ